MATKKKTAFEKFLDNPVSSEQERTLKGAKPLTSFLEYEDEGPGSSFCDSSGRFWFIDVFPCGTAVTYTVVEEDITPIFI